jgi:hypothetical protein
MTPEQEARKAIDARLIAAGWLVQDRKHLNLYAGPGVALCETAVEGGFADYMLFVDAKAISVLEAKAAGTPLVAVAEQSEGYATAATTDFQRWGDPIPFTYESNGEEYRFHDLRDPRSRSRFVFGVHRPETLRTLVEQTDTLRADRVKTPEPGEALTNLISLVRFAAGQQAELAPFPELARQRFQDWLTRQETATGKPFTTEQRTFLVYIAAEIGANAALETDDLDHGTLKSRGGLPRALALFGKDRLPTLLEELNTALAA